MKTINDNEYLTVKISAREAMYRAMKAIADGKEDCTFKIEENQTTGTNHPDFKGFSAAAWINKEKSDAPPVTEEKLEDDQS